MSFKDAPSKRGEYTMKKKELIESALDFVSHDAGNSVDASVAISPDLAGMQIFDPPLVGFRDAEDETWFYLISPKAVGPHFMLPRQWLPGARTVISCFLPFTRAVRESNAVEISDPSAEWLHARIEGQAFLLRLCRFLAESLEAAGHATIIPVLDPRFGSNASMTPREGLPPFTSRWSERHVAYTCGLGTFSLSKGLITERGVAGRFGSVITTHWFKPDAVRQRGLYDNCIHCGACARNCPVGAITLAGGKEHPPCADLLEQHRAKYAPRYGCGKCQVGVPCEARNPAAK